MTLRKNEIQNCVDGIYVCATVREKQMYCTTYIFALFFVLKIEIFHLED